MSEREYSPKNDGEKSYLAAIEAKRHAALAAIKREVVIGDCRLLLGDCAAILPALGKFQLCLTDPPYGISVGKMGMGKGKKVRSFDNFDWDDSKPSPELMSLLVASAKHAIIWGGNYFALPPSGSWLAWDKVQAFSGADAELAWSNLGKPLRVFRMSRVEAYGQVERLHPTQKPLPLMEWCLSHVPDARTVIDPFMGSGTTGVACAKRGLAFTGIERHAPYFEIACERIRKAYAQPDMFIEARAPEPVQEALFPSTPKEERAA